MNRAITYIFLILAFGCKAQEKESRFEWNLEKKKSITKTEMIQQNGVQKIGKPIQKI
ncbi:hypothetical protein [Pseudozobellia sp. WGM2]|uniref:hypothetical protein n=1 Tax=Pseudozobellia sp. WGM2 TaxID=2787625 RepID=UPI001ADFCE8A|nr:hypothetical protein [Pseudozobellia sp. WGM2]